MNNLQSIESLTAEFQKWCRDNGYDQLSADEIQPKNSQHALYLLDFISRWDDAQERARIDAMRDECQKAYCLDGMQALENKANFFGLTWELCSACAVETPCIEDECVLCGQTLKLAAV